MNRYKLFKAGIDTNTGINRFNGNAEMYEKYLYQFPQDVNFNNLKNAVVYGDIKTAFVSAHSLKGVAGNLSLSDLYRDLTPLVEELRAGRMENISEMLITVSADYQKIIEALECKS